MTSSGSFSSPPSSTDLPLSFTTKASTIRTTSGLRLLDYTPADTPPYGPSAPSTPPPPPLRTDETSCGGPVPDANNLKSPLPRVGRFARTIHGWSWQAFPIGMGTGAVYVCLSGIKTSQNSALFGIETCFYILNLVLFTLNSLTLILQALLYPRQSLRLITDSSKNIFVPVMVLNFATIIIGTVDYAVTPGHIGPNIIYILFWIYVGLSVGMSFPLLMIWFNKPHDLLTFSPAWAFLFFPMMLVGTVAYSVLLVMQPTDTRAIGVLFVGYFFQGIGFCATMAYICIYFVRLITTGFMEGHQASGAFVACGPPGFTAYALIGLGGHAQKILPAHDLVSPLAGEIWYASSVLGGLLLFGFAVFLFVFAVLPYWWKLHRHLREILGCWALTFPNVGWISAVHLIGEVLHIPAFRIVHMVMAALICVAWVILFSLTCLAIYRKKIFFDKPEDVIRDELHVHMHMHIHHHHEHHPGHAGKEGRAVGAEAV
ncbi:hypothetical protein FA95DRAFT_1613264 [Auriscalpium vulgare]|uniref:Uncharacterized protein n=1 Tax=Auriscalpium vulgare TaxID=40419 RepID=A0ACB8R455_9AGAM|nr:hypothetical protein FA95DRAFT_1613264 [Auriscalpium vulgare]